MTTQQLSVRLPPRVAVEPSRVQSMIRLAALPAEALDPLVDTSLSEAIIEFANAESMRLMTLGPAIDELFEAIGREIDPSVRGHLLAVRRDLHNGRYPRRTPLETLVARAGLPATKLALESIKRRDDTRSVALSAYPAALERGWTHVLQLSREPSVQEGILASSQGLANGLAQVRRAVRTNRPFSSRDQQVLRGALRYASRSARKATPFSTFCLIADLRLTDRPPTEFDSEPWSLEGPAGGSRVIRLNKAIFGMLWDRLKEHAEFRRQLHVELNPTLEQWDGHLSFLASIGGREVFQRIERSAELDLVFNRLAHSRPATLVRLASYIRQSEDLDATQEEVEGYLSALVDAGLLRFVSPVSQFEAEWQVGLAKLCAGLEGHVATAVHVFCQAVTQACTDISSLEEAARRDGLARLDRALCVVADATGKVGAWPRNLLYEDYGVPFTVSMASRGMKPALAAFESLTNRLMRYSQRHLQLADLRDIFDESYPDTHESVPLLRFFERIERGRTAREQAAVTSNDDAAQALTESHGAAVRRERKRIRERWMAVIRTAWQADPDTDELDVSSDDIFGDADPRVDAGLAPSRSFFCELIPATELSPARVMAPRLVALPGLGKMFSRFLHVLPAERTDALRQSNERPGAIIFAEIAGDGYFNGNLHPPLLKDLLSYPAGDGDDSTTQVKCSNVVVSRDEHDERSLILTDRTSGRRVVPVDLGFMNPEMRPPLYRLLLKFSPIGGEGVLIPETVQATDFSHDEIVYRPRIVVDGSVVIARRSWRVPYELFPAAISGEAAAAAFLRIVTWRLGVSLPDRVYVRVLVRAVAKSTPPRNEAPESDVVSTEKKTDSEGTAGRVTRPSRDLRKPQFLDLRSPIFVDLLARLVANTPPHDLLFEEAYPTPEQSPLIDGRRHVAECLVQFDRPIARHGAGVRT